MTEKIKNAKKRKHRIDVDYIMAVADRLHSVNPTKDLVFNTIKDVWCKGYVKGYLRRISDARRFKELKNARLKESFDSIIEQLEDELNK